MQSKASSLRVLDVEERRREIQISFGDVRRPERAAVAHGLAAKRCTWSPWRIGRARAASAKLPGSLASNNERVWCRHDPAGSSSN